MADHPLVVLDHLAAGAGEALRGGHVAELRDDAVVEPDEREVGLGDDQVLVVARVGDRRELAIRVAREVEALAGLERRPAEALGAAHLQPPAVVLVELLRARVAGTGAVERVEVEARGAALAQLGRRDVLAERDLRPVEREVVVDELPEVGVAGRDRRVRAAGLRHRLGELAPRGPRDPPALRPAAAEAERRRLGGCGGRHRRCGRRVLAAAAAGADESFAEDEEALGAVSAARLLLIDDVGLRRAVLRHLGRRLGDRLRHVAVGLHAGLLAGVGESPDPRGGATRTVNPHRGGLPVRAAARGWRDPPRKGLSRSRAARDHRAHARPGRAGIRRRRADDAQSGWSTARAWTPDARRAGRCADLVGAAGGHGGRDDGARWLRGDPRARGPDADRARLRRRGRAARRDQGGHAASRSPPATASRARSST